MSAGGWENGGKTLGMGPLNNQPDTHLIYWVFIGYIPFSRAPGRGLIARGPPSQGYQHFPYDSWWFGAWWFGFVRSPSERRCYSRVPLEMQGTNPKHQFTTRWVCNALAYQIYYTCKSAHVQQTCDYIHVNAEKIMNCNILHVWHCFSTLILQKINHTCR